MSEVNEQFKVLLVAKQNWFLLEKLLENDYSQLLGRCRLIFIANVF